MHIHQSNFGFEFCPDSCIPTRLTKSPSPRLPQVWRRFHTKPKSASMYYMLLPLDQRSDSYTGTRQRTTRAPSSCGLCFVRPKNSTLCNSATCTRRSSHKTSLFAMHTHGRLPDNSGPICLVHTEDVHAPRLLVSQQHQLYFGHAVRCDYSSADRTGSTSTSPCAASTRLPAAAALYRLRRTPRHRLLGVRLLRLLISTSKLVGNGFRAINN
jgi:hypothetical protein